MKNNPKGNPETLRSFRKKWSTSDTKVIRVPSYLASRVLQYALDLDSRKDKSDRHVMTSDDVRKMLEAIDVLHRKFVQPKTGVSASSKAVMNCQLKILLSLVPTGFSDATVEQSSSADRG